MYIAHCTLQGNAPVAPQPDKYRFATTVPYRTLPYSIQNHSALFAACRMHVLTALYCTVLPVLLLVDGAGTTTPHNSAPHSTVHASYMSTSGNDDGFARQQAPIAQRSHDCWSLAVPRRSLPPSTVHAVHTGQWPLHAPIPDDPARTLTSTATEPATDHGRARVAHRLPCPFFSTVRADNTGALQVLYCRGNR